MKAFVLQTELKTGGVRFHKGNGRLTPNISHAKMFDTSAKAYAAIRLIKGWTVVCVK